MSNSGLNKSSIARHFIFSIVIFSSFITIIITAFQLYRDYNTDINLIHTELDQIESIHLDSLNAALWASNHKLLQTSIDGILKIRDMQYVEIRDEIKRWASAGKIVSSNNIQRSYAMTFFHRNQNINIGTLTVNVNVDGVFQRLYNTIWVILISNAIKISLVALFIYFLFYKLVGRHLSTISGFSEMHDPLSNNTPLTLDRNNKYHDEFDVVVNSINDMHTRLNEKIDEINHQKQYLSQTLNSIGDAVITTDNKGNVTRLNPVAEQLTGWTNTEALNQPLKNIFPIVNASTREPIANPVEKVLATGETVYLSNHTSLIAKDGSEYQIADSAAPILDGNDILGMVLVFNDVTEQYLLREKVRTKEQEQREILQSMVDAVITIDEKGIIQTFNHSAELLFGYSGSEVLDTNIKKLMPEPYFNLQDQYIDSYLNTGEAKAIRFDGREVVGLRKNKQTFPMRLYVAELPATADGKRRFIGSCTDLTQAKEHDEQLRRSQKMDALGKLTGGIAHDYNNMLGVILGYSDLLKDMLTDQPKLLGFVEQITRAGERGAKLTNKLLAFSRKKSIDIRELNINTVLHNEQHMLEKTLTARIELKLDLEIELWPVSLDESELEDTILNMSINAMHAIEANGILTIKTRNVQLSSTEAKSLGIKPGDYVQLCIIDTGSGMDNSTKEKIFDPFYSTKGEKGTGLGLSQVYGFIQRCEGTITVDTELNNGTYFSLYFPRYRGVNAENKQPKTNKSNQIKGSETILVVDDELALLNLTFEILSPHGYQVFRAEDAKQALKILQKENIDLLISDIIMPGMDGYTLASIVQKKYPHIKIQLASGFSDNHKITPDNDELSKNSLHKPYHLQTLLNRVRELLE